MAPRMMAISRPSNPLLLRGNVVAYYIRAYNLRHVEVDVMRC